MDRDLIWSHIHEQRRALATLLADLDEDGWSHPSLCAGWRVREVAAHVISSPAMTFGPMVAAAAGAGFRYNHMVDREARKRAEQPVAEILADYAAYDGSRRRPPGTANLDPLIDVLVHTQDVAIPLGLHHAPPPEAAALALPRARRVAWIFGTAGLVRRHRFEATDADWSAGKGELMRGTAQELLLTITGRSHPPT
jgi:uncharacterized protein (TIGR03083 family)